MYVFPNTAHIFSGPIESPIFRGCPKIKIGDIKNGLEANSGPILSKRKCDVETWSIQWTNTWRGLYSKVGNVLCPAVQLIKEPFPHSYRLDFKRKEAFNRFEYCN